MSRNRQGMEFHYTNNGRVNGNHSHSGSGSLAAPPMKSREMQKMEQQQHTVYDMTRTTPSYYEQRYEHHDVTSNMRTRRAPSPSPRSDIAHSNRNTVRNNNNYRSSSHHYPEQQQQQQQQQHQQQHERRSTPQTKQTIMSEDEYTMQVMKEREDEIIKINQQMHTVGEIYKDLAHLVEGQQELIDQIDNHIDLANGYTQSGREQFKTAKMRAENPILEDPFGDKLGNKSRRHTSRGRGGRYESNDNNNPGGTNGSNRPTIANNERRKKSSHDKQRRKSRSRHSSHRNDAIECSSPLEAMPEDMQHVLKAGFNDMKELGTRLITACTLPDIEQENEYAYRSNREFPQSLKHDYASRNQRLTKDQW